jgi:AraC-like DNA-binding protein
MPNAQAFNPDGPAQAATDTAHRQAVERAIQMMRERLHEPLALDDLAASACLSPFHFSRVFRQVTGSPPGQFLAALRLNAAKLLLLTTPLSVTDVCFEVGYSSLGSFTTRFTQFVGMPPASLRRLPADFDPARLEALNRHIARAQAGVRSDAYVTGRVVAPGARVGTICVGLFAQPIPQGYPIVCTMLPGPGAYRLGPVPDGRYYLLSAGLPWSDDPLAYLLPGAGLLVGVGLMPLTVQHGVWSGAPDLILGPPRPTDPPIVVALPLLLARFGSSFARSV